MEKISVVIPNYNGQKLLEKNLPEVIKNCPNSQIIVVDDASTDGSAKFIKKKFKNVNVICFKKNKGFAAAANAGVLRANENLVLLLNSDVSPRKSCLPPALKYFKKKDTFSVGLEDQSHENGKIIPRGRGGAGFKRGLFTHFPASLKRGFTLWTSGGSSLINREKFLKLRGFDEIYKPFYWEDIDLGFRAWRAGYKLYFEPLSKVDHFHEKGAIINTKSALYVKIISYRNHLIFIWKNFGDYYTIVHLFWLPFHLIKAIFKFDFAFLAGLVWATALLPQLVLSKYNVAEKFIFSEREVLKELEKE